MSSWNDLLKVLLQVMVGTLMLSLTMAAAIVLIRWALG